jgi:hypothetical protein
MRVRETRSERDAHLGYVAEPGVFVVLLSHHRQQAAAEDKPVCGPLELLSGVAACASPALNFLPWRRNHLPSGG